MLSKIEQEYLKSNLELIRSDVLNNVIMCKGSSFNDSLTGFCANMSYLVFHYLYHLHYEPLLVVNDNHCFVLLDGFIIDLTASQFSTPDLVYSDVEFVNCNNRNKIKSSSFWDIQFSTYSDLDFFSFLEKKSWPLEQRPVFLLSDNAWYSKQLLFYSLPS
jgi:hypothetical protein